MDNVTKIFLEELIEKAKTENDVPWHKPWKSYNQFNWATLSEYSGINRWLLPNGEYLTMNQFKKYNESVGYKYHVVKGSRWFPILYVKNYQEDVTYNLPDEIQDMVDGLTVTSEVTYICSHQFYNYFLVVKHGIRTVIRVKKIRKYYKVADRTAFIDDNGEPLPSRVETNEVNIVLEKPENIADSYIIREGIKLHTDGSKACYSVTKDSITVPNISSFSSSEYYYGTLFHEMAHSTGAEKRLKRNLDGSFGPNPSYSREEVVAELTASLLCAESGIQSYDSQNSGLYDNSVSYVKSWIRFIENTNDDLVYIFSDAEKAFKYILYNEKGGNYGGIQL